MQFQFLLQNTKIKISDFPKKDFPHRPKLEGRSGGAYHNFRERMKI